MSDTICLRLLVLATRNKQTKAQTKGNIGHIRVQEYRESALPPGIVARFAAFVVLSVQSVHSVDSIARTGKGKR
jgi:hypothetical protein